MKNESSVIGAQITTTDRYYNETVINVPVIAAVMLIHHKYKNSIALQNGFVNSFISNTGVELNYKIDIDTLLAMTLYSIEKSLDQKATETYHDYKEINDMAISLKRMGESRGMTINL